jgi:sugar lactone lactonase YvrE
MSDVFLRTARYALGALLLATVPPADAEPLPAPIVLPGDHLHPESLSIAPDGTAYIGSMTGGVLKVRLQDRKVERFVAPGFYGSGALFGVYVDTRHGLLWTCTNTFPVAGTKVDGADPGHWVKAFDLKTGAGKVSLPMPGDNPVCNDFALGPDGTIYVTDTGQPRLLRWKPGAANLEVWAEDPVFNALPAANAPAGAPPRKGGLDGLAFGGDGAIYVNNVRDGSLYRVIVQLDGRAGAITRLTPDRPLQSPDGMRAIGGMTFLIAEGAGRIARLTVSGDAVHVETLAERIKDPTGVDVEAKKDHSRIGWYVQAQLSGLFNPDKAPPVQLPFKLSPVTLAAPISNT